MTRQPLTAGIVPAHLGGGTDTYMRTLIECARRRSDVHLDIVTLAPDRERMVAPPGIEIHYVNSRVLNALLYVFREARNPVANVLLLAATSGLITMRGLGLALRRRYDIVYAVGGPIAGTAAALISGLRGIPAALHFHWAYHFRSSPKIVRGAVRRFYDRFSLVIGNSRLLAEDAHAIGVRRARCTWVYNWVDSSVFTPLPNRAALRERLGIAPDRFVFLYVGRFCHTKQVDTIAEALRRTHYDATFLFAGDGVLDGELRELASQNDVRLLGTRSPAELATLHTVADVLLWGSVDVDYPGLAVMEAMSSGLPVVTSNLTMNHLYPDRPVDADVLGGPELTRHYPPTPEGIQAAIEEALARRKSLASMRPAVRAFAIDPFGEANADRFFTLLGSAQRR